MRKPPGAWPTPTAIRAARRRRRPRSPPAARRSRPAASSPPQNGTTASVAALVESLNAFETPGPDAVEVVVAPTLLHLAAVAAALRPDFAVAAQNCWVKGPGAWTGEVAAELLADAGVPWVILGHSERRQVIGESDALTADKVAHALSKGLKVIYCVGETLAEREAGATMAVVERQMAAAAAKLAPAQWADVVVAYEPVWAIGTGKVATPEQAQEVHAGLRAWFATAVSADVAAATRIIYGGSVTAANCVDLGGRPDIDGFLVGGASLKPEFADIVRAAA